MVKIMENPIKMDDLGVSLFLETPICISWYEHLNLRRFVLWLQTTQNSLRDRVDFLEKLMGESADKHSQAWFDSTCITSRLLRMVCL